MPASRSASILVVLACGFLLAARVPAQGASTLDEAEKAKLTAFYQQLEELSAVYDPIKEANTSLLDEGQVAESTRRLLDAVPEAQRTAVHDFLLGNMLFDMDPAVSLKLHERAQQADPDNVMIRLEWALELQRAGRLPEAEAAYAQVLAHPAFRGAPTAALHAETLLRLGRTADAVAAWRTLDVRKRHTEIEETLAWVHGARSPWARRAELLAGVAARQADAARDLIVLDLHFDRNWWNETRRDDYVQADLARLDAAFGEHDPRVTELHALALIEQTSPADPMEALMGAKPDEARLAEARSALTELGFIGPDTRDAADDAVGDRIFAALVAAGIASWDQVLADHGARWQSQARSSAGDRAALKTLCGALEGARSDKLHEADRLGWERYGEPSCAASLLAASLQDDKPDTELLAKALAAHPDDASLLRLAVQFDDKAGRASSPERLTALILAASQGPPDAHELDALYARLGEAGKPAEK